MAYTVHQAKTHFSRLIKEAEAGQEVIVLRGKKPVAKIVPILGSKSSRRELAGAYRGMVQYDDKAFAPLSDNELAELGFDALLDGELVPPPAR